MIEKVIITQFKNITEELAFVEGEGDKSLKYYQDEHTKILKKIEKLGHSFCAHFLYKIIKNSY